MDDPTDDPVLLKYARIGALAEARETFRQKGKHWRATIQYELIDKYVATCLSDRRVEKSKRTRQKAIGYVMKFYKVSERTVETALDEMKKKREAEEAHTNEIKKRLTAS
jgi:hypothetical protein